MISNNKFNKLKVDSNYIEKLNEIINTMIKTNPNYNYIFEYSFKTIKENQDFYIDNDNFYIYFPPYEIAP